MTDLHTALIRAAGSHASDTDPDDDLGRARQGLRRHRIRRIGLPAGAAIAVAGCVTVVAVQLGSAAPALDAAPPAPTSTAPASTGPASAGGGLTLVANTTKEPSGFGLAVIPKGWEVVYDTPSTFVLGPTGVPNNDPDGVAGFVDRIAVVLQRGGGIEPTAGTVAGVGTVTAVQVAGRPAALVHDDGSWIRSLPRDEFLGADGRARAEARREKHLGAPTLWVKQPDGAYLVIQIPTADALTDQQVVELAEGITIKPGAVPGEG